VKELYYSEAVTKLSDLNNVSDYKSDIYVLALFKHQEHATLDILDMDQWCFYVLSREKLREVSGDRSSVSIVRLEKNDCVPVTFSRLKDAIY